MGGVRTRSAAGLQPLSPQRKWRAITIATLVLVPAFWAMLAGMVSAAVDDVDDAPNAGAAFAFGVSLVPFVFLALAFLSQHPQAPSAVVRAMGLALLVGVPVLAFAGDGVTALVAGTGAGGIVALRADELHDWRSRAMGVAFASAYAFVLVRVAGPIVLLSAPVFPLTAIGIADHLAERRRAPVAP